MTGWNLTEEDKPRELLQQLDPRYDLGQIRFEGGIDV
jgi:hypothetical protein